MKTINITTRNFEREVEISIDSLHDIVLEEIIEASAENSFVLILNSEAPINKILSYKAISNLRQIITELCEVLPEGSDMYLMHRCPMSNTY